MGISRCIWHSQPLYALLPWSQSWISTFQGNTESLPFHVSFYTANPSTYRGRPLASGHLVRTVACLLAFVLLIHVNSSITINFSKKSYLAGNLNHLVLDFKSIGPLLADAFYKSICPYTCVCVSVCLLVHLLRYRLNIFWPPQFLEIQNPWGKNKGKKWTHIWKLLLIKGVK